MKCGGVNHFARVCRSSSQDTNLVQSEGVTKEEECVLGDSEEEVLLISVEKVGTKLLAKVEIQVGGSKRSLVCQLDTAASCNVLAWGDYVKLGKPKLLGSATRLTIYDGTVKSSLGRCQLSVKNWENKVVGLELELLKTQQHSLLSLDTCLELQLLTYETESVCMTEANHWVTKEELEQAGIIARVDVPTPWISNLTEIKPSNGTILGCPRWMTCCHN